MQQRSVTRQQAKTYNLSTRYACRKRRAAALTIPLLPPNACIVQRVEAIQSLVLTAVFLDIRSICQYP